MSDNTITLRFLAEPTDVNFGGKVFGGSVMKWIDHAGYTCAVNWARSYCVTAFVGGIQFLRPIKVGDLVELRAEIMHTGTTSMHISVGVYARNPMAGKERFTTHCILVFVAVDADGKPASVPSFAPATAAQQMLNDYACNMIELRKGMQAEQDKFLRALAHSGNDED